MTKRRRNVRTGARFADRPTEWTTAVVMIVVALGAFRNDHDLVALVAVLGAAVPVVVTAATAWWEKAHAVDTTEPTPVVGSG